VGDYTCKNLTDAKAAIIADGFKVGTVTGPVSGVVVIQSPAAGVVAPFQSEIDLTLEAPSPSACPPAP
jgi:beta-lactam-binding protein with PASTA domain